MKQPALTALALSAALALGALIPAGAAAFGNELPLDPLGPTKNTFVVGSHAYGGNIFRVEYTGAVPEGKAPALLGQQMMRVSAGESAADCWVGFVMRDNATALNDKSFTLQEDENASAGLLMGDANDNGVVNVIDAQIAYDLGRGLYTSLEELSWRNLAAADATKDGTVDAVDALRIQALAHQKS